jgi:hypothetical protein
MIYYALTVLLLFILGLSNYMDYKKEYEQEVYGFDKFDNDDYFSWAIEWFIFSFTFPISIPVWLIIRENIKKGNK